MGIYTQNHVGNRVVWQKNGILGRVCAKRRPKTKDLRSKIPIVVRTDVCRMRMYINTIELGVEIQCRGGC